MDRARPRHRAAHRRPTRRPYVGGRRCRRRRNDPVHAGAGPSSASASRRSLISPSRTAASRHWTPSWWTLCDPGSMQRRSWVPSSVALQSSASVPLPARGVELGAGASVDDIEASGESPRSQPACRGQIDRRRDLRRPLAQSRSLPSHTQRSKRPARRRRRDRVERREHRDSPSALRLHARWGARHLELAAAGAPAIAAALLAAAMIAAALWLR